MSIKRIAVIFSVNQFAPETVHVKRDVQQQQKLGVLNWRPFLQIAGREEEGKNKEG